LQIAIDKLIEWSKEWLLKFNNEKCKVMHIGNNNSDFEYIMESKILSTTEIEKDLGVYLSKDLKWDFHINYMINKANRVLGMIKHPFKYLNKNSLKLLFTSLVRSQLEYAAPIWNSHSNGIDKIKQIENIQRRATRILSLKGLSYEDRLLELGLPTLEKRRNRGDLIEFFKIIKNKIELIWHNSPRLMNSGK
jgi:ribonuclease P/MRP protein subunit RPP40